MNSNYKVVEATKQEIADLKKSRGHAPIVDRVECKRCGHRLWLSGVGERAHERKHARASQPKTAKTPTHKPVEVKASDAEPNGKDKPVVAKTKAAKAVAAAAKLHKGDLVEVREQGIRPWTGKVLSVKFSSASGWHVDVTRDDDPGATWTMPEEIAHKVKAVA